MTKTGWLVVGAVVIVVAVALFWWNSASAPAVEQGAATNVVDTTGMPPGDTTQTPPVTVSVDGSATLQPSTSVPMSASVTYDGSTFSPASVTIAKGGTVTFTDTAGQMWVASGVHPSHTTYDGTTESVHCAAGYAGAKPFDECGKGSTYTFTFDKVGSWGYHDHTNASAHGTIVVQ